MKCRLMLLVLACAVLSGCSSFPGNHAAAEPDRAGDAPVSSYPAFTDITEQSGLDFVHYNGASSRRLLPETMGSGAAFFDYDGDRLPDLYLVNSVSLENPSLLPPTGALFRNLGDGKFQNVTRKSGLEEPFFGMGAAVGDIDNDGMTDLFVSGVGGNRLYRNLGGGHFRDVTKVAGVAGTGFASSSAFLDYDGDGFLDLFVGQYVEWSPDSDIPCSPDGVHRTYCTPEVYPAVPSRLYRNVRGTRFEDVTFPSGIGQIAGKALGVAVLDYDLNGWPDIAVANDTVRNFLFVNRGDGTFSENGVEAGMAYSESGAVRGGMGIDARDLDGNGLSDIVIGNFSQEMVAFWRSVGNGYFVDDAAPAGIGLPTLMTLAFGTLIEDFNGDGHPDILIANGHIEPDIARIQSGQSYRQQLQLFWNLPDGRFVEAREPDSSPLQIPLVGRGLASADIDGDGDLDVVVTQNGGRVRLLRNEQVSGNWIRLKLEGSRSNRTGYGTRFRLEAGSLTMVRELASGRSYLSASEPVVTFGLGTLESIDRIEILWPGGERQSLENPPLNSLLEIVEP